MPDGNKRAAWACLVLLSISTVAGGLMGNPTERQRDDKQRLVAVAFDVIDEDADRAPGPSGCG